MSNIDFYKYQNNLKIGLFSFSVNKYNTLQTIIMDLNEKNYFSATSGYSAFGPFYKFNWNTNTKLYKRTNKQLKKKSTILINKRLNLMKLYKNKDCKKLLSKIDILDQNLNLFEINLLFKIWKNDKDLIDENKLLQVVNDGINNYSDFVLPYKIKGEIYSLLALGYYKQNNHNNAKIYSQKTIDLINNFAIGSKEKMIKNRVEF